MLAAGCGCALHRWAGEEGGQGRVYYSLPLALPGDRSAGHAGVIRLVSLCRLNWEEANSWHGCQLTRKSTNRSSAFEHFSSICGESGGEGCKQ